MSMLSPHFAISFSFSISDSSAYIVLHLLSHRYDHSSKLCSIVTCTLYELDISRLLMYHMTIGVSQTQHISMWYTDPCVMIKPPLPNYAENIWLINYFIHSFSIVLCTLSRTAYPYIIKCYLIICNFVPNTAFVFLPVANR